MNVQCLIENLVYQGGLFAEHGLSQLIDTGTSRILFDTGQSPAFLSNASRLGVDLTSVDSVVISHGHYDHTGGLYAFLTLNKKAKVFLRRETFDQKYYKDQRFIGTSFLESHLRDRVIYVEDRLEIDKGVFIMPPAPLINASDTSMDLFQVKKDGNFEPDWFQDEISLAIVHSDRLSVLSSCSHRGITNITRAALDQFQLPLHLVLGGFHLKDRMSEQFDVVLSFFEQYSPDHLGVCHCTGIEAFSRLTGALPGKVFYHCTGNSIDIL